MDTEQTKVIFRKFKDDKGVIAYFPELPGTNDFNTCLSYMHLGQHGSASIDFSNTLKAYPSEYESLKKELESLGYNLKIGYRMSGKDTDARIKAITGMERDDYYRSLGYTVPE